MDSIKMDQSEDTNNTLASPESQQENQMAVSASAQAGKQPGGIHMKKQDLINIIIRLEDKLVRMKDSAATMRSRIEYLEGRGVSHSKLLHQIHMLSSGYQQEPLGPGLSSSPHSETSSNAEIINYTPQGSPTNSIQYTICTDSKTGEPIQILLTDSSRLELNEINAANVEVGANVDIVVQPPSQLEERDGKQPVSGATNAHKIMQENPEEQVQIMNLDQNETVKVEENTNNTTDADATGMSSINSCSDDSTSLTISGTPLRQKSGATLKTRNVLHSLETSTNDQQMTQIGSNGTPVPTKVLDNIQWKSANSATRILLRAIFGRQVLAVSSMTGKASPAFKDKPLKQKLDPLKLKDIITIVTQKCKVDESSVRKVVTTMCSDENKNLRLKNKKSSPREGKDKENESAVPDTSSIS